MSDEVIFAEDTRNALLPIKFPSIWELVKKQRGCFWQTHEVSLAQDKIHWKKLDRDEQYFIKTVLAFFASSDLIVNKNLIERFINDAKPLEIQMMYRYQAMMEDIHSEMYALLIDSYIDNPAEKADLFNAVKTVPIIAKKAAWAERWIDSELPYSHRLLAFAAIEGIFFSGSFCAIFWLKERGIMPGLTLSNDFISRDEGLHVEGAVTISGLLKEKASEQAALDIFKSAVELETEFITEALPCKLIGMNASMMIEYIKYVANRMAKQFGYNEIYPNVKQPFNFMDRIGLDGKSNFFERRPSEYNKLAVDEEDDEDPYAD